MRLLLSPTGACGVLSGFTGPVAAAPFGWAPFPTFDTTGPGAGAILAAPLMRGRTTGARLGSALAGTRRAVACALGERRKPRSSLARLAPRPGLRRAPLRDEDVDGRAARTDATDRRR